ncbi:MAG: CDP-2,3-bis-(O-geranylgeranyl)-sn-glycerol synthase [Candidatus Aenigmarchaeota archaeon]|nr:CDP-2,3-bis-(O-geranylgeranyl)-sn-glycerol synthase [Candidatus Aenigmarchaeota archaeon]
MEIWLFAVNIFWFIAPSYVANGFPPVMRGKRPMDFGKKLRSHRILGGSKTIEGTVGGMAVGLVVGYLQVSYQHLVPVDLYEMTLPLVVALVVGTMAGDIGGSFIKRRLGMESGDSALLLDQLGFLSAALAFAAAVQTVDAYIMIALIVVTPPIHLFTNYVGCRIVKVKKNPW